VARLRSILFAAWTFTLAAPFFVVMLLLAPITLLTDKFRCVCSHIPGSVACCTLHGAPDMQLHDHQPRLLRLLPSTQLAASSCNSPEPGL